jgi:hypothetical protein
VDGRTNSTSQLFRTPGGQGCESKNRILNDQAIRFSVDQHCFPFRIMRVYNLISYINFTAMGRAVLRRWRRLFDLVLQRFERIRPEEQCTDSQDQEFR